MSHYELDRLGWFGFERLVQALLKAEFGAEVESWSGYRDQGKDAYCAGDLKTRAGTLTGPVIFQAKFVHQANASGSEYMPLLKSACVKELALIQTRLSRNEWKDPRQYFLLTNCPISPSEREAIVDIWKQTISSSITILGYKDVSDLLDLHPHIARVNPQILTFDHLLLFLQSVINGDISNRSQAALTEARTLLPIFVPTEAYEKSWEVLKLHNFVVLTGAPEMGKTAIGRMLAMAQLQNGWEVIDCYDPNDIFKTYSLDREQVFIADDAFGRTEYDVQRGAVWEAQFSKIYNRLDRRHWLIWTSRRHILSGALRQMDLQGPARKFPEPAEVIVQADHLSVQEKAEMLFRHSVNASLTQHARSLLKSSLQLIIHNGKFTPERIRRLTMEVLPTLAISSTGSLDSKHVSDKLREVLENPTEMMRKAHSKLSAEHKWILVTLLDEQTVKTPEAAEKAFKQIAPFPSSRPFQDCLQELDEGFIRITTHAAVVSSLSVETEQTTQVGWVHPSYRDLVIDQLATSADMRLRYLKTGGGNAIKLALSHSGGAQGKRNFPLLQDLESWSALEEAVSAFISTADLELIGQLLSTIAKSLKDNFLHSKSVASFASSICHHLTERWSSENRRLGVEVLENFYGIAELADNFVTSPSLLASWQESWTDVNYEIKRFEDNAIPADAEIIFSFAKMLVVLHKNEPRFLKKVGLESQVLPLIQRIRYMVESDANTDWELSDADEFESEEQRMQTLSDALDYLREIEDVDGRLRTASRQASNRAHSMGSRAAEMREDRGVPEREKPKLKREVVYFDPNELFREFLA